MFASLWLREDCIPGGCSKPRAARARPGRRGLEPGAHPPVHSASWASRPPGTLHSQHPPGVSREAVSEDAEGLEGRL